MSESIRVGAVSYLNTRPLVWGLEHDRAAQCRQQCPHEIDLVFDLPSRLADRLSTGELDVALIPSVEYFRGSGYTIVSDACIACRGPVLSVKLYSRVPVDRMRTLALDEGSRTSAALVRVLLGMRQNVHPQLTTLPIGAGLADATTDGVLLIGDRAIKPELGEYQEVWDLGDVWCRWTELPFVYAMWVARSDGPGHLLDGVLSWSRNRGLEHLSEIARTHAAEVGVGPEDGLRYLRDNLYFYLGPQERRGLDLYYRYAAELGLVPAGRALKFHDCSTT